MTLTIPLSEPITFGTDAIGQEITAEEVAIKWMSLDFTTNKVNFECTLPNRPDVCFSKTVDFDPSISTFDELTAKLADKVTTLL